MSSLASPNPVQEQNTPHLQTSPLHIQSIVTAIDFSEPSTWAAKYAAGLAKQLHSRLSLLHIVPMEAYTARPTLLAADLERFELERGRDELRDFAAKIPEVRIFRHEEIVLCGPTIETIDKVAELQKADLIVMGSHGRSGVSRLALGSIAETVIRHQHRPVLVTGPQCMRRYTPLKSIVLAVDLPATSLRAVQYATSIARQSGAMLAVVHVVPESAANIMDDEKIRHNLQMLVPHDPDFAKRVSYRVLHGEASEKILNAARSRNAGILVLGAKERPMAGHAPWTTLSHIIREATCPVLAVQPHLC